MERFNIYHRQDGRYEGRISRGKRKNGRRCFQYFFGHSREEVQDKMTAARGSDLNDSCDRTVGQIFSEWFQSIQHRVKESTAANYRMKAEKHILPAFSETKVDLITASDIYVFIASKQNRGLSNRYISDILIMMKSVFKYASKTYRFFNADSVEILMHGVNVEVTDCKISEDTLTFTLKNESGETIEWKGSYSDIREEGSSKVYGRMLTFENFPEGEDLKGFDDIYTIMVSLTDKAGRKTTKDLTFSVNRFGSTYDVDRIKDVLGTYAKTSPTIVVSEINSDELTEYSVTLFKNNETIVLDKGTDYDVDVIGKPNEWHEYIYTIADSNFADDGVYSITLHSVDKAKNVSENTLDTKDSAISFVVDNTAPIAMVANLESGKTYAENIRKVIMTADDNILLSSIAVYLDNDKQVYKEWLSEEIANILGNEDPEKREFSFDINGDSTRPHTLKIVCTDAAGNVTELSYDDFYVTTNMWIRFINNKPVMFGSIAGILLLAAGVVFIIVRKRKRS